MNRKRQEKIRIVTKRAVLLTRVRTQESRQIRQIPFTVLTDDDLCAIVEAKHCKEEARDLASRELDRRHTMARRPARSLEASKPPTNAEFILHLLLAKDEQEGAIGDFLERYAQKLERLGGRRARIWAYSEVCRTVWPVVKRTIAKISGVIAAAEWVRRHLS